MSILSLEGWREQKCWPAQRSAHPGYFPIAHLEVDKVLLSIIISLSSLTRTQTLSTTFSLRAAQNYSLIYSIIFFISCIPFKLIQDLADVQLLRRLSFRKGRSDAGELSFFQSWFSSLLSSLSLSILNFLWVIFKFLQPTPVSSLLSGRVERSVDPASIPIKQTRYGLAPLRQSSSSPWLTYRMQHRPRVTCKDSQLF